jgi:predicted nucleic acid-binding protein
LALPEALVLSRIELFARFDLVTASVDALKAALSLRTLHQLSFWDALILQAARDAGCAVLLSEDLAAGATLAGVRIVDPFAAEPAPAAAKRRRPR